MTLRFPIRPPTPHAAGGGAQPTCGLEVSRRDMGPGVLFRRRPACRAEAVRRCVTNLREPSGEVAGIPFDHVPVHAVHDEVGRGADGCAHDRDAARERLEHHERIRLVRAGQHQDVGGPEGGHRVGKQSGEGHAVGQAESGGARACPVDHLGRAADDEKVHLRGAHERVERDRQALPVELVADEDRDDCVMKPLDGGLPALEGSPILEKHDG